MQPVSIAYMSGPYECAWNVIDESMYQEYIDRSV